VGGGVGGGGTGGGGGGNVLFSFVETCFKNDPTVAYISVMTLV
jgi:hypothetical protein